MGIVEAISAGLTVLAALVGFWKAYQERRVARDRAELERLRTERDALDLANEVENNIRRLTPTEREWLLRGQYKR